MVAKMMAFVVLAFVAVALAKEKVVYTVPYGAAQYAYAAAPYGYAAAAYAYAAAPYAAVPHAYAAAYPYAYHKTLPVPVAAPAYFAPAPVHVPAPGKFYKGTHGYSYGKSEPGSHSYAFSQQWH